VRNHPSCDGVVQSAGAADDTTGGFRHGGWHLPYFDELAQTRVTTTGAILVTYARDDG
jgi:hypothetical protein